MMRLKGVFSDKFAATGDARPLPPMRCAAVILSVQNTVDDGRDEKLAGVAGDSYFAAETYEIYWGFKESAVHQIFPTQTTDYIFVENLSDIYVRCNKKQAGMDVYFSVFVEVKED